MEVVIKISQFLLSLSILIVLHELGHFIPAKLFKTKVEKFYLFFDVKYSLFKKKIGETEYGIGWLPLGGYVKIAGMIDESMDKEQMAKPPQPWEFRSKPAWQRLIIMLGGVTVNFVLAYIIYSLIAFKYGDIDIAANSIKDGYQVTNPILTDLGVKTGDNVIAINGEPIVNYGDIRKNIIEAETITIENESGQKQVTLPQDYLGQLSTSKDRTFFDLRRPVFVGEIPGSSLNASAGLKPDDVFISINNQSIKYHDLFQEVLPQLKGQKVDLVVRRDNADVTLPVEISSEGKIEIETLVGGLNSMEDLGYYDVVRKNYGFAESWVVGWNKFTSQMTSYGSQLKKIFTPSTGAYKGVGGFKAIYDVFPDIWSWEFFWGITAFLSIMLGVLNLLPIPALDGGHVMFLLYEMITQRKPSEAFLEKAQMVGFFILIALVLFANGNDVVKAIFN